MPWFILRQVSLYYSTEFTGRALNEHEKRMIKAILKGYVVKLRTG
jgi:hypothetical protein